MERSTFIGLTVAFTVYSQLMLKYRALSLSSLGTAGKLHYLMSMFTDIFVLSGLGAAVAAAVCWILAIERTDIGLAYPFMALSFVIVPVAAALLFRESISIWQMVGLTMIVTGVAINALLR